MLIPAVRRTPTPDQWLADLDFRFWHANPTVWLERIQRRRSPNCCRLSIPYFVPAVLLVAFCCGGKAPLTQSSSIMLF